MSTTYEYECANRIAILKSNIEAVTGETYSDLTAAIQGLKDNGGNIEDFVEFRKDLGDVTLSNNLTKLRIGAFADCYVGNVSIPEGITEIPRYAFYDTVFRTNATVILPNSLRTIGADSFLMANMDSITIPEGVTTIDEGAFYACSKLTNITIPESVTTIEDQAFSACPQLLSAIIDGTNLTINSNVFVLCNKLSTVTFKGATPVSIHSAAFGANSQVTTINVPWAEGAVANAPWGATNATINYNYTEG